MSAANGRSAAMSGAPSRTAHPPPPPPGPARSRVPLGWPEEPEVVEPAVVVPLDVEPEVVVPLVVVPLEPLVVDPDVVVPPVVAGAACTVTVTAFGSAVDEPPGAFAVR